MAGFWTLLKSRPYGDTQESLMVDNGASMFVDIQIQRPELGKTCRKNATMVTFDF